MRKPIIGIVSERINDNKPSAFHYSWYITSDSYLRSVSLAGGIPLLLLPTEDIEEYMGIVDGLLFQGGKDIDPSFYGEEKDNACGPTDTFEDEFHLALLKAAIKHNKPILGICRGFQLINVAFGGTLYQDLENKNHKHYDDYENPCHGLNIKENTQLYSIFGSFLRVNSLHHQGVKTLGKGLIASGYSDDGLIEALEKDNIIAIQCHPEALKEKNFTYLKLFKYFIDKCKMLT